MHLSSLYMFQRQIDSLTASTANFNDIAMRLGSLQTLLKPSDDPAGASQAVVYQNALAQMDQYDTARLYAQDMLGQEDTVLNSIGSILTKSLAEKIVAGGNGTYSDEDRAALSTELQGIRDNLLDLANSRNSNGRYIFAGYKTGSEPFAKDGSYLGGDTAMRQKVADSTDMAVGHTGKDVFMSGSSDDLFAALDKAIAALQQPIEEEDERAALQATLDSVNITIKHNIDNLGKIQAEVGTSLQQLERLATSSETGRIELESRLQQTVGSDPDSLTTLIAQSKMTEFALTSSFMVFQSMQKMSIFNRMT